jgi:predicted ArsR family transcriptional regulator
VLHELLDVLAGRLPPDALAAALRETGARLGARLAPRWAAPGDTGRSGRPRDEAGERRRRAEGAVSLLGELGGLAELEQQGDVLLIRGLSCPFAEAVPDHPEACGLAAALLAEVIGAPVRERCPRAGPAGCLFEVPLS